MKWALHRRRGRRAEGAVIDGIHQHADAEHVGCQDELLALGIADLADAGEPVDGGKPFLRGGFDIAHETVKMLHQRHHDLAQARIGDLAPALNGQIGQIFFGYESHGRSLEWRQLRSRGFNGL
jgi:hypothetical protein